MIISEISQDKAFLIKSQGVHQVNLQHEHRLALDGAGMELLDVLKDRGMLGAGETVDGEFQDMQGGDWGEGPNPKHLLLHCPISHFTIYLMSFPDYFQS